MTTSEVLRAAAKRLREQGWTQRTYGEWRELEGECCLMGAIRSVTVGVTIMDGDWQRAWDSYDTAVWTVEKSLHRKFTSDYTVSRWNDHAGRTAEEVIALLEDTAAELEARP